MRLRSSTPTPKATVFVVVGSLALVGLGAAGVLNYARQACSKEERAVFREFPHYADRRIEPYSTQAVGACIVRYTTQAPEKPVLGYYKEQLREHGWRVRMMTDPPLSELPPKQRQEATEHGAKYVRLTSLKARRDGYTYIVEFHPKGSPEAPSGRNLVFVMVTNP